MGFLKFLKKPHKEGGTPDAMGDVPMPPDSDIDIPPAPPSTSFEGGEDAGFPVPPVDAEHTTLDIPDTGKKEDDIPVPPISGPDSGLDEPVIQEAPKPHKMHRPKPKPEHHEMQTPIHERSEEPLFPEEQKKPSIELPPEEPAPEISEIEEGPDEKPPAHIHTFTEHKIPIGIEISGERTFTKKFVDFTKPLFIKINTYQTILNTIDDINSQLGMLDDKLVKLNELETNSESNYEKWRKNIENTQKKITTCDTKLFKS